MIGKTEGRKNFPERGGTGRMLSMQKGGLQGRRLLLFCFQRNLYY